MARKLTIDTSITSDIKSAASDSFKDNIRMIEIDKIKVSLDNFYSLSDIETLADDIERQGLKHNLVVVEDSDASGTYFIKSGHRRFTAIKQLISENRYTSKYVPCLIDGSKTKDENILDLIMLNATTRVMTDAELFNQYSVLKETLERLKESGTKVKGRLREKVAEALNISPAQVGKIENIKHNAVDEVKSAVENGDMSIATADNISKLDKEEQKEIISEKNVSDITTKSVKEHTEKKKQNKPKKALPDEDVVSDDDILRMDYEETVEESNSDKINHSEEFNDFNDLYKWASKLSSDKINFLLDGGWYNSAIKGYLIASAQNAGCDDEQITNLLDGMKAALEDYDKQKAEMLYLKR